MGGTAFKQCTVYLVRITDEFRTNTKVSSSPSQHTVSDHHRLVSETPFEWRFARGSMEARRSQVLDVYRAVITIS